MNFLPKKVLSKLAKKLKKETGCTHMAALEQIVKQLGFHSWNHYCKLAKEQNNVL